MIKRIAMLTLVALMTSTAVAPAGGAKGKLIKQASVTRSEAEHIALSQIPDGKMVGAQLKKEHGRLFWCLDFSRPGTKDITEVQVNAKTGSVISTRIEKAKEPTGKVAPDKAKASDTH